MSYEPQAKHVPGFGWIVGTRMTPKPRRLKPVHLRDLRIELFVVRPKRRDRAIARVIVGWLIVRMLRGRS